MFQMTREFAVRLARRSSAGVFRRPLGYIGQFLPLEQIPVLAYHSVGPSESVLSTHPAVFHRQLAYLKARGYGTISLSDYLRQKGRNLTGDERAFLITFDDGFEDLHTYAFPILQEFSFTAVVFLATGFVGQRATWIARDMDRIQQRLVPNLQMTRSKVRAEIEALRRFQDHRLLSWSQVQEMHRHGIDFQSHSCSHPFLSDLTPRSVRREVAESKAALEAKLGRAIECFAYPYGDYNHPGLKTALPEAGYAAAFCDDWSAARDKAGDPYETNRIPIGNRADAAYLRLCFSAGFPLYCSLASLGRRLA
ncbi:MAG: polysaccharide deacetylase family protein [Sedimentisphaerales bacterium]|nr:polysaccharide deacetylase family protein [Sedimentisphaerales bacterium]